MKEPILSFDAFRVAHLDVDSKIAKYFVSAWADDAPTLAMTKALSLADAPAMQAINLHTRIAVARAAEEQIKSTFEKSGIKKVVFIDLVSKKHTMSLADSASFDTEDVKKWVRKVMGRTNYFGAIDAGFYYAQKSLPDDPTEPLVSWHAHIMAWDIAPEELMRRITKNNQETGTLLPGAKTVHGRIAAADDKAVGRAMYMLKAPIREYSLFPRKKTITHESTGEVSTDVTGRFSQKKRLIGCGNFIQVVTMFGTRPMKSILIAGGAGRRLKIKIFVEATFQLMWASGARLNETLTRLGLHRTTGST